MKNLPAYTKTDLEELIQTGPELVKQYLEKVITVLHDAEAINQCIRERHMLQTPRNAITGRRQDSAKLDLAVLANHFNGRGNIRATDTFSFVDLSRFNSETKIYLREEDITDREKIALISVYFSVGTTLLEKAPEKKFLQAFIQNLQLVVAHELRNVAGFATQTGYEPKPKMISRLQYLLKYHANISRHTLVMTRLLLELNVYKYEAIQLRHALFPDEAAFKQAAEAKTALHYKLTNVYNALLEFSTTHDFFKIFNFIHEMKVDNRKAKATKWFTCRDKYTRLIESISETLMRFEPLLFIAKKNPAENARFFQHPAYIPESAKTKETIEKTPIRLAGYPT